MTKYSYEIQAVRKSGGRIEFQREGNLPERHKTLQTIMDKQAEDYFIQNPQVSSYRATFKIS